MKSKKLKKAIKESIKGLLLEQANYQECLQSADDFYDIDVQIAMTLHGICVLTAQSICAGAPPPPPNSGALSCLQIAYQMCDTERDDALIEAARMKQEVIDWCNDEYNNPNSPTASAGGGGFGSCFIAGTKVKMADGTNKNIENVEIGEEILGQNGANKVIDYDRPKLGNRKLYSFNGGKAFVTAEHPFMTLEGWKSIDPNETLKENPNLTVGILNIKDTVITDSESITIESIEIHEGNEEDTVYNFNLDGDYTYYADGYLVHNKENVEDDLFALDPGWEPGIDGFVTPGQPPRPMAPATKNRSLTLEGLKNKEKFLQKLKESRGRFQGVREPIIEPETNDNSGCTDPQALNYDPTAVIDNGSCNYDVGIEPPEDPDDMPPIDQGLMEMLQKRANIKK